MNNASYRIRRQVVATALVATAITLSGCQTASTRGPAKPRLILLEAQPPAVPANCDASGSYFVEFTVMSDGRAGEIQAPAGPACIQQALTAWVSTFRYEPPGQDIPSGVEWMMVSAPKAPGSLQPYAGSPRPSPTKPTSGSLDAGVHAKETRVESGGAGDCAGRGVACSGSGATD